MIVYGSALWLIEKITLPGGREVTDIKGNLEGTRVAFILPDLGNDTGRLTVVAKYGSATNDGPINDHQSGDVLSNLTNWGETGEEPRFNWSYWGAVRTNDAAKFPGTKGYYLNNVFGGVTKENGAWWEGNRSGNFDSTAMFSPAIRSRQASDYALKFEVSTKEPWTTALCLLRISDKYAVRWEPFKGTSGNSYHTDHQWVTITVPLSAFRANNGDGEGMGANAMSMSELVLPDGRFVFGYRFISTDKPIDIFNAAFDNFRIVKIK